MNTTKPIRYTCAHCGAAFTSRIIAQLHYQTCDHKPIMQKLSQEDFQRLLNRAREIDVAAGREAKHGSN